MNQSNYDELCIKYFNEPWTISRLIMKRLNYDNFVFTKVEKDDLIKVSSKIYIHGGCYYTMTSVINVNIGNG
jgi:hypothetical protein